MIQLLRNTLLGALVGLTGGHLWAQQLMPRLIRQMAETPGVSLKINEIKEDRQGRLWLATHNGLVQFDGQRFRVFHDPALKQGDYYYHCVFSPDGRIWLKQDEGYALPYFDPQRQQIRRVADTTRLIRQYLAKDGCHYVFADSQANLWIGLRGQGMLRFNPRTGAVDHVFTQKANVRWITQDEQGRIWFTSDQGLYVYQPLTNSLTAYRPDPQQPATSLGSLLTYGVHVRPDGTILIGLDNEIDLLNPATGQIRRLRLIPSARFPRQAVFEFFDDGQGNTYFQTKTTLYRYTRQGVIERIEGHQPMQLPSASLPSSANRLWVAWVAADRALYEYDLGQMQPLPPLNLLDVVVNGTRLETNSDDRRLERDSLGPSSPGPSSPGPSSPGPSSPGRTTLTIQENDLLSIRFSPYASWHSSTFRFRLQGYDQQWHVEEDLDATASYQLPAGDYLFALNRGLKAGQWEARQHTFRLVVEPPFWKTGWFLGLVGLTLLSGLVFLYRSLLNRYKLRQQLIQRQMEADNLRQLDELKSRFFANITHELRTPLTIILNATEQLTATSLNNFQEARVESVQRNAHQLMRLINETLDVVKLDAGKLDRRDQVGDPVAFVKQIVAQFTGLAEQKQIILSWSGDAPAESDPASTTLYRFDDDKLEKIVYNILANALKFTPAGGQVRVESRMGPDSFFVLRVADTGIGIPADQLTRIFERFHQVDNSSTRTYAGTGIGLALVKELTEWLGGTVTVDSTMGQGSVFTVTLPLIPAPMEPIHETTPPPDLNGHPVQPPASGASAAPISQMIKASSGETTRPLLLVVEDNEELRSYITGALSAQYRVITAENGQLGLEQALREVPNLIVSDVMMPGIDGFELVERLKADDRTSHIPLVLLTAKSSYESRMKGLGAGADDYLGKPFSLAELGLRISNCLRTRQNWQRRLTTGLPPDNSSTASDARLDREDKFLSRLRELILNNLTDETVDVDWLTSHANMSRTQLHRKLTALTNMSTTRFIHSIRLERAAELLQSGESNVAQVAYQVGYDSPSYFTKMFQEHFGRLPRTLRG